MLDHETLGSLWIQPVKRSTGTIKSKEEQNVIHDNDYTEDSFRSSNTNKVFQNVKATFNSLYRRITTSSTATATAADKVTSSADEWCPVDDLKPPTDAE